MLVLFFRVVELASIDKSIDAEAATGRIYNGSARLRSVIQLHIYQYQSRYLTLFRRLKIQVQAIQPFALQQGKS